MRISTIASTVTLFIFIFVGCSKKNTNPVSSNTSTITAPAVPYATFSGPSTSSSNTYALLADVYAGGMTGLMSTSSAFSSTQPTSTSGNVYSWSYSYSGFSETFKATRQSDGSYSWQLILNGSDGTHTYNNFVVWSGTTSADGKSGSWSFYDISQTGPVADLSYTTSSSNVLTGTMQSYNTSGVVSSKCVVVNNSDHSGSCDYWGLSGSTLQQDYHITWNANGTGSWTDYTTTPTSSGTWS